MIEGPYKSLITGPTRSILAGNFGGGGGGFSVDKTNLAHWWDLNEASGSFLDSHDAYATSLTRDFTSILGTPDYQQAAGPANLTYSAKFLRTSSEGAYSGTPSGLPAGLAGKNNANWHGWMWVRPDTTGDNNWCFSNGSRTSTSSGAHNWILGKSASDQFHLYVSRTGGYDINTNTSVTVDGTSWYFVDFYYDSAVGTYGTCYLDVNNSGTYSSLALTNTITNVNTTSIHLHLNRHATGGAGANTGNNTIAQCGWFEAIQTPTNISAVYNSGAGIEYA